MGSKLNYLIKVLGLGMLTGIIFGVVYSLVKTFIGSPYLYFTQKWPALLGNLLLFSIFCSLGGLVFALVASLILVFSKKEMSSKKLVSVFTVCFLSFTCAYSIDWWLSNLFFGYRHFLPHSLADSILFFSALVLIPAVYFFFKLLFKTKRILRLCALIIFIFLVLVGERMTLGFIEQGFSFNRNKPTFLKGNDLNVIVILVDAPGYDKN